MSNVSKANLPRQKPGFTHNNKPRYRSMSVSQLEEALEKSSTPKIKDKIRTEINRRVN